MPTDDKAQQPGLRSLGGRASTRALPRWIARATRKLTSGGQIDLVSGARQSVHAGLRTLPTLLDSSSLPNGVVELLIDDFEEPTRQLFDIHDGHIKVVEPGAAVPWACIAGPPTAWAMALGPERNTTALRLAGDEQLARRVLAALPPPD